jgi:transketolase
VVVTPQQAEGLIDGAYVVRDADDPDLVLIGTGSEVAVALDAADALTQDGLQVRVVSMPSWDLFDLLDDDAQEAVLPTGLPTLAVEAGSSFGWGAHADDVVSIDRFGASAPGAVALEKLGISASNVVERAHELLDAIGDLDHEEH